MGSRLETIIDSMIQVTQFITSVMTFSTSVKEEEEKQPGFEKEEE